MELTKSLDVSDLSDDHIKKLEVVAAMDPEVVKTLTSPGSLTELSNQNEELRRVIKRLLQLLEQPEDFSRMRVSFQEMAQGIRHFIKQSGIVL